MGGFREFVMRGNVVDLAVGVIIGVAFGGVVTSLTTDILTPALGMLGGVPDFSEVSVGSIAVGNFINAVVTLLLTAFAIYIAIVKPYNAYREATKAAPGPPPPAEVLLTEIRDLLKAK